MIVRLLSAAAVAVFLSAPAFAQSMGDTAKTLGEQTGVNQVLGVTPTTADFVSEAAMSDMFEVQAGQLAVERGDAATKAFAQQMITDHKKTAEELKGLISSGKVKETLPMKLDSSRQETLDDLAGLHGADFDKQYRRVQVASPETAGSLFQGYAASGDTPALQAWAGKTLPHLQAHLQTAEKLAQ